MAKRTAKLFQILIAVFLAAAAVCSITGCSSRTEPKLSDLSDFETANLGTFSGSVSEFATLDHFPHAKLQYYDSLSDLTLALRKMKIDGFVLDKAFFTALAWEHSDLSYVDQVLRQVDYSFIYPKNEIGRLLNSRMAEFLAAAEADGTLTRLRERWFSSTEPQVEIDFSVLTGESGTINLAIGSDCKPFIYRKNGSFSGYEMELIFLFAEAYGYSVKINEVNYPATLMGVETGKYDMGAYAMNLTPERDETMLFSVPHYTGDMVLVIRNPDSAERRTIETLSDLEHGTIGILTGTVWDTAAASAYPRATRRYYSNHADMLLSLEQGKIDAIFEDKAVYINARWEDAPVRALDTPIGTVSNGLILSKEQPDETLLTQLNAFIARSKEDGTLTELEEKWFSDSEPADHPDYSALTGENGTLQVAVETGAKPLSYLKDDSFSGFEIDFLTRFAEAYGYRLRWHGMTFDAMIPAVAAGRCDIGAGSITITPERAECVTFTDPYLQTTGLAIVYHEETQSLLADMLSRIAESFEKTFLREQRWRLILDGICISLCISICAAAAGTLLGFGLYLLTRSSVASLRRVAAAAAKVYVRIIAGTPVVVILMILFYVILGRFRSISGVPVAILGFALTFGAFVYSHMTVSVNSIDPGQAEAAYALGYTRKQAFFRILLPQAMSVFLPPYCGQAVELIKATAVVGYIAVNDLTKAGDIIRSNTYEAFFPLLAIAAIYFLLTWLGSALLNRVKGRLEPKNRSRSTILRGIRPYHGEK